MLVCAPTGAGKTNVALLTVLRLIHQKLGDGDGKLDLMPHHSGGGKDGGKKGKGKKGQQQDDQPSIGVFKIVYLAPMKALCAEVVDKFSQKLQHLGIQVRELTGDMQLSKAELDRTHVIVTVPEKWDILTRNSAGGSGVSDTGSLQKLVELIIIDEIHLLNESRGAIIETVVARTMRFQETASHFVRLVGISATLPNYQDVAEFLRVDKHNTFFFDAKYRPIPLQQSFIGIHKQSGNAKLDSFKKVEKMVELCYDEVFRAVEEVGGFFENLKSCPTTQPVQYSRDIDGESSQAARKTTFAILVDKNRDYHYENRRAIFFQIVEK